MRFLPCYCRFSAGMRSSTCLIRISVRTFFIAPAIFIWIHHIFLFVKNERGTPLLEGVSYCFAFLSRDLSIFSAPDSLSGRLLPTRAITREKLQVRLLFFPTFTSSFFPAAHRCAAHSAFLFNCSGSKYGEADDSPHSVLGALARVNTYLREHDTSELSALFFIEPNGD